MVDEKVISGETLKIITEALKWTEENNNATYTYRDFYNYVSGISDLANELIRKLDKK